MVCGRNFLVSGEKRTLLARIEGKGVARGVVRRSREGCFDGIVRRRKARGVTLGPIRKPAVSAGCRFLRRWKRRPPCRSSMSCEGGVYIDVSLAGFVGGLDGSRPQLGFVLGDVACAPRVRAAVTAMRARASGDAAREANGTVCKL